MAEQDSPGDYRVLARKYRPQTFDELVGQDAMVRTLSNAIDTGRLAHAFILTGVRGVGKTTTARIIATALNCERGPTITPCGECEACRAIAQSRHVDVLEMDAASRTGVDDIREIIDGVQYATSSARYRIYIIDEIHMLSKSAFNALLKTLEEPPDHVKFIFATTEIRKLPVTVLSRCQRFDLRRVESETMVAHLAWIAGQESAETEDEALKLIARAAEGSVRDALSLLDQAVAHGAGTVSAEQVREMLGLADRAQVLDLFKAAMAGETEAALSILRAQYDRGADPQIVFQDLLETCHWVTRLKAAPDAGIDTLVSEAERTLGKELAGTLSMASLSRAWQMLIKGLGELRTAPVPITAAEMALIRLCYSADLPTPAEVIATLRRSAGDGQDPAADAGPPAAAGPASARSATGTAAAPAGADKDAPVASADAGTAPTGGENTVLAFDRAGDQGDHARHPLPVDFPALVRLFEDEREGQLAVLLKDRLRLVSYAPGRLALMPDDRIPPDTAMRLKLCLEAWTGRDWVIIFEREGGGATLTEQAEAAREALKQNALAHPLVRKALEQFPNARLVDVRTDLLTGNAPEGDKET